MNDLKERAELIGKIKQQGLPRLEQPCPLVSLEDFFTGNADPGSIGCNLSDHPGISTFYDTLKNIRAKPNVQDVLVEINDIEEEAEDVWPFSDRIYILTSGTHEDVTEWVMQLEPDEIEEGFAYSTPPAAPQLEPGMKVYSAWWD